MPNRIAVALALAAATMAAGLAAAAALAAPDAGARLLADISSPRNDYNFSPDAALRTAVFARSDAEFANAKIMVTERRNGRWTEPRPISFSDDRWADSDPWLTPDGATLYFISTRPTSGREEGRADYDIWRAHRTSSGWSAPEHLGPSVNSRGQELGPETHGGTLYFSSARRSGAGGLDIYAAPAEGTGFGEARLIDGPFNGPESDSDFTLSPDGATALFWRMVEGKGLLHISRRGSAGWSTPEPLPPAINHGPFNFTPAFAPGGRSIWYASTREQPGQDAGLADIFVAALPPR
ncbi:MAG: TolB family protein [Allosphingosinicella sp.]|uniref:TolB family protein n=1 Tax=Allosphingosinicella sp. TaxID=2823234 RepID=UPI00395E8A90